MIFDLSVHDHRIKCIETNVIIAKARNLSDQKKRKGVWFLIFFRGYISIFNQLLVPVQRSLNNKMMWPTKLKKCGLELLANRQTGSTEDSHKIY